MPGCVPGCGGGEKTGLAAVWMPGWVRSVASPLEGPTQQAEFGPDSTAGIGEGCQLRRETVKVLFQDDAGQPGGKKCGGRGPSWEAVAVKAWTRLGSGEAGGEG